MTKINILFGIKLLLLLMIISGCAGPWNGKIIDVETKDPLEGAVVLAIWQRVYRTPAGDNSHFYEAKETVTDKEGKFEIPSYTPINLLPLLSYMRGPEFTIFKPGYGSLRGQSLGEYFTGEKKESKDFELYGKRYRYNPGVIELSKLKTRDERKKLFPGLLMYDEANKKAKNYMRLLNIEANEIGLDPYPIDGGIGK